jgi:hypothetical protein
VKTFEPPPIAETAPVHIGHVSAPVAEPVAPRIEVADSLRLELLRLGYGPIGRSADIGLQFRAAILAFEYDHHRPLTADPSEALVMLASATTPVSTLGAPDARKVSGPHAERTIQTVQSMLTSLGFKAGAADGRLSETTAAAIRAFEADQGLKVTGRISALVMTRLAGATGARSSAQR